MDNSTDSQIVAQGAKIFDESQKHRHYMEMLDTVRGYMRYGECDYGHCGVWDVQTLPDEVLLEVMQRGRTDEIAFMISRYGQAAPPEKFWEGCSGCGHSLRPTTAHILPEKIQVMIAERNNKIEIDTYLHFNGFCEAAQDVIMARGDHDEIMRYVMRHGLGVKQQRALLARCDHDEILVHISKHGLHIDVLKDMFDDIHKGGDVSRFYEFITRHELPVEAQKMMLETVGSHEFQIYVSKFGLWTSVHEDLVKLRSEEDVCFYLKRHRYLSRPAEKYLAQHGSHEAKRTYVRNRYEKEGDNLTSFAYELMCADPLDYEVLADCFLKPTFQPRSEYRGEFETKALQAAQGSHQEMMAFIAQNDAPCFDFTILPLIFFRNNREEFEAFVKKFVRC